MPERMGIFDAMMHEAIELPDSLPRSARLAIRGALRADREERIQNTRDLTRLWADPSVPRPPAAWFSPDLSGPSELPRTSTRVNLGDRSTWRNDGTPPPVARETNPEPEIPDFSGKPRRALVVAIAGVVLLLAAAWWGWLGA